MHELLQQVRLIDPAAGTDRVVDLLLEAGVIRAIAPELADYPSDTCIRDCRGLVAGPGLVDLYSHSGEPGFEARETLESLMQSAIAGGFTRLNLLPDTNPPIDRAAMVTWVSDRYKAMTLTSKAVYPQLSCWAALTDAVQGQQMTEVGELAAAGVIGFADGKPIANLALLRRLLEYLQPLQKPIALWACDLRLEGNGVMREGKESMLFGLPGSPGMAETTAIAALLECVAAIGTPIHLMRVSTARGVALIRQAKALGLPITASVTWMHLLLNTTAVASYDPNLRLNPPLGNLTDQMALVEGVAAGVIDAIAIDHSPYTYEEKTVAFAEAPPGAIGLELALPLLWHHLVATQKLSALKLWACLSNQPLQCLNQLPATIAPNNSAELILFDPDQVWLANAQSLHSIAANTPWFLHEIVGQVTQVWL